MNDYTFYKSIKQTETTSTSIVKHSDTGIFYVSKSFNINEKEKDLLTQKLRTFSKIEYPTILSIDYFKFCSSYGKTTLTIYTKYFSKGSLFDLMQKNDPDILTKTSKYIILLGICLGMNYLQKNNINNLNVKTTDIFLDDNFYPKIDIFNIYNQMKNQKSDISIFSEIFYELFTNKRPPIELSKFHFFTKRYGSEYVQNFISLCISEDISEKPTFNSMLYFLSDFDDSEIDLNEVIEFLNMFLEDSDALTIQSDFLRQYECEYEYEDCSEKVEIFLEKAVENLKRATEKGNINAMKRYAILLEDGILVTKDLDQSVKYYEKAVDEGDSEAMFQYSNFFMKQKNSEKAIYYLQMSADKNYIHAIDKYVSYLFENGKNELAMNYVKTAADYGYLTYMRKYATFLKKGEKIEKNLKEAAKYFKKAADKGDSKSIYKYAKMFQYGDGVPINLSESLKYHKKSADIGNKKSIFFYAKCLKEGICVKQNFEDAVKYFKIGAQMRHFKCMYEYAKIVYEGKIAERNWKEAIFYFKDLISVQDPKSMYKYALIILKGDKNIQQNLEDAEEYFKQAADYGDVKSMREYSKIVKNEEKSAKYKKMADERESEINQLNNKELVINHKKKADQGDINSMYQYATYNYEGKITNVNFFEAFKYFKKAAKKGHLQSTYNLGNMYFDGKGIDMNKTYGLNYIKKAADEGYVNAIFQYGVILQTDLIWKPDLKESAKYFKIGADKGHLKSMHQYAICLQKGYGVPVDLKEAAKYFKILSEKNEIKEIEYLKMILSYEINAENAEEFARCIIKGAEMEIPEGMYLYGMILKNNPDYNKEESKKYFKKAAMKGNFNAMTQYILDCIEDDNLNNYERFKEEAKQYEKILLDYKEDHNKVFVDKSFPPLDNWKRIDEIYKAPLFKKDLIAMDFINQGTIGNCCFISGLSKISQKVSIIKELFNHELPDEILGKVDDSINIKCGAVVVYFQAFGRRTPVLIDTFIPVDEKGVPICSFLKDDTKSPWFCLIEKAFAKLNFSYEFLDSITLELTLYSLLGYYSKFFDIVDIARKRSPIQQLIKYYQKGFVIVSSINETDCNIDYNGLVSDHGYLIVKIKKVFDIYYICLHNPWSSFEWKGMYSKDSYFLTPGLKEVLEYDKCGSGTFWMKYTDFFKYFHYFEVSKPINPKWKVKSFSQQLDYKNYDENDLNLDNQIFLNMKSFVFQITENEIPNKKIKIHILIERTFKIFSHLKFVDEYRYFLILGSTNGERIQSNQIISDCDCLLGYENVQCFSKIVETNQKITLQIAPFYCKDEVSQCFYIYIFCPYKFILYDIDKPDELIQDIEPPGANIERFTDL